MNYWILLFLLGVTRLSTQACQENCVLNFIEQPVTTAVCRLYEAERVVLACTVSSEGVSNSFLSLDQSSLTINWFFNNGTEHHLSEGINETRREGGNGAPIVITSKLSLTPTNIARESAVLLAQGNYYCQVDISRSDSISNSSQQFTVFGRNSSENSQHTSNCSGRSFTATETSCAVITHCSFAIMSPTTTENTITMNPIDQIITDFITVIDNQSISVQELTRLSILSTLTAIFLVILVILAITVILLFRDVKKMERRRRLRVDQQRSSNIGQVMAHDSTTEMDNVAETEKTTVTELNVIYSTPLSLTSDIEMQSCDVYAKVGNKSGQVVIENSTTETGNVVETVEQSAIYSTPLSPTSDIEMQSCDAYVKVDGGSITVMEQNVAYGTRLVSN